MKSTEYRRVSNVNELSGIKLSGKTLTILGKIIHILDQKLAKPEEILVMVESKNLSAGHARSLIGLNNALDIAKKIVQKKLSVRQAEVLTRQFRDKKFKLVHKKDPNILDLQKNLEDKTGLNVSINNKKNNSGSIVFEYQNLEQLDKIIDTIKNNY